MYNINNNARDCTWWYSNEIFLSIKLYNVLYGILSIQKLVSYKRAGPERNNNLIGVINILIRAYCLVKYRKQILLFAKYLTTKSDFFQYSLQCQNMD